MGKGADKGQGEQGTGDVEQGLHMGHLGGQIAFQQAGDVSDPQGDRGEEEDAGDIQNQVATATCLAARPVPMAAIRPVTHVPTLLPRTIPMATGRDNSPEA